MVIQIPSIRFFNVFTQEGGNLRYLKEMRRTCSPAYTEGSAMHEGHLLRRFFIVFV